MVCNSLNRLVVQLCLNGCKTFWALNLFAFCTSLYKTSAYMYDESILGIYMGKSGQNEPNISDFWSLPNTSWKLIFTSNMCQIQIVAVFGQQDRVLWQQQGSQQHQCKVSMGGATFRILNFASHFIRVQIFQIDFPLIISASKYFRQISLSFYICRGQNEQPAISQIYLLGDKMNSCQTFSVIYFTIEACCIF